MRKAIAALFLVTLPMHVPAFAAVDVTFFSHRYGQDFAHAFIKFSGQLHDGERPISENYGFTATVISPAILLGKVSGEIETVGPEYIRHSQPRFRVRLSDDQYYRLLSVVNKWRNMPAPSYDLHHQNCVSFVASIAAAIGLRDATDSRLIMKPRAYLDEIARENTSVDTSVASGTSDDIAAVDNRPSASAPTIGSTDEAVKSILIQ